MSMLAVMMLSATIMAGALFAPVWTIPLLVPVVVTSAVLIGVDALRGDQDE